MVLAMLSAIQLKASHTTQHNSCKREYNNNTSKTDVAPWCFKWDGMDGYGWISGWGGV